MLRRWSPLVSAVILAGCSAGVAAPTSEGVVRVVAAENFWGSVAAQIGGVHAEVTSIITDPNADPHSYEPTARDAREIATSQMVIANGVGYDPWTTELLAADGGSAVVLDVGQLLHLSPGDNPHRWYNPSDVAEVIAAITADYARLDPADAGYFEAAQKQYLTVALRPYDAVAAEIKARFAGTPIGASESIVSMLAPSLGLDVVTPYSFLRAISEGGEVSAADKTTIDGQIKHHLIKIYVYNSQNTTPDVQAQLAECKSEGIPTTTITETLAPSSATYQDWQTGELRGILAALSRAASP